MQLPSRDPHGNYWWGKWDPKKREYGDGPAIFSSTVTTRTLTYLAYLGKDDGCLFDGPMLKRFLTPFNAMVAIQARLEDVG